MKTLSLGTLVACTIASATLAEDAPDPVDQFHLNKMIAGGQADTAFLEAFEAGDELTELSFDAARGVGANIGEGRRFSRFPRADLTGPTD